MLVRSSNDGGGARRPPLGAAPLGVAMPEAAHEPPKSPRCGSRGARPCTPDTLA